MTGKGLPSFPSLWNAFWLRTRSRGDCWEHMGAANAKGYRLAPKIGMERAFTYSHRLAFILARGVPPKGLFVDHMCKHRWCVRPSHLRLVTLVENVMAQNSDSLFALRSRATQCAQGHGFSPENTIRTGAGHRQCRTCENAKQRRRFLKRKKEGRPDVLSHPNTHCHAGHPMIAANVLDYPKTGRRVCRLCRSAYMKRYRIENPEKCR